MAKKKLPLHIIILAAGKGVRMYSSLPKVLHKVGGKTLLEHVIEASQTLCPEMIHVVYGSEGGEKVKEYHQDFTCINWVEQKKPLGTGHAVQQVLPYFSDNLDAEALILYGDVPLITENTLKKFLAYAKSAESDKSDDWNEINLITAKLDNPFGYGRIIRDDDGKIVAIKEEKDANEIERQIKEINSGILYTAAKNLKQYLPALQPRNAQGEYYLTDIISAAILNGKKVNSFLIGENETMEILGVNSKEQLERTERAYQKRMAKKLLQKGVTLLDANRLDVRGNVAVAKDVIIDVNVVLEGKIVIGNNSTIGANCYLKNVTIGENVKINANCVIEGALIEDNCIVGPFARLRPETRLEEGAHIGNFVEVKKSVIGKNSKANHLSYVGDAIIGEKVNVGAGTITCNYDGVNKHQTVIKDGAFIGSNVSLVAPIEIGENATIGAGSTINRDAKEGKLTLARAEQVTINDWQRPEGRKQKTEDRGQKTEDRRQKTEDR